MKQLFKRLYRKCVKYFSTVKVEENKVGPVQTLTGVEIVYYKKITTPEEDYKLIKSGYAGHRLWDKQRKILKVITY